MKNLKHSKYKNTAILFEMLVRKLTSETLTSDKTVTVEIIKKDALVKNHHLMDKDQREHVTQFFYQNYDNSKFYWLDNRKNLRNLAIDTQDDLNRAKKLTQEPYNFDYRTPVSYISKFQLND